MPSYLFKYPSTGEAHDRVLDDLFRSLTECGINRNLQHAISVAVSEAFTNAVVHGNREDSANWMWLNQSDVDTWMAAISFYPAEHFSVFDDRYFVSYQRPYGNSVLLKKRETKKD